MHTLGMSHQQIGKNGKEMTVDGVVGMLRYAAKNSKGFNVKLTNQNKGVYKPKSKQDKPKVVNTSPQKVKLYGTIVKIN
jgi:hypothetical protein